MNDHRFHILSIQTHITKQFHLDFEIVNLGDMKSTNEQLDLLETAQGTFYELKEFLENRKSFFENENIRGFIAVAVDFELNTMQIDRHIVVNENEEDAELDSLEFKNIDYIIDELSSMIRTIEIN